VPKVRVVDEAGTRGAGHLNLSFYRCIEVTGLAIYQITAGVNAGKVCARDDAGGTVVFGKLIDQPHRIHDLRFSLYAPYKIRMNTLMAVPWQGTVVVGTNVFAVHPKHVPYSSQLPGVHEDRIKQTITIHGFDHGICDPTNALLFRILWTGALSLYGLIIPVSHFL
jgi:hypothetical protein